MLEMSIRSGLSELATTHVQIDLLARKRKGSLAQRFIQSGGRGVPWDSPPRIPKD